MVESKASGTPEQHSSPEQLKDAYEVYREQMFNKLEREKDPLLVDTEAAELLFLVLRNPGFTQSERLKEFAVVAQLTMSRMCEYVKDPQQDLGTVWQAELIHHTYGQVFAQSLLELAKLPAPVPPPDQP